MSSVSDSGRMLRRVQLVEERAQLAGAVSQPHVAARGAEPGAIAQVDVAQPIADRVERVGRQPAGFEPAAGVDADADARRLWP